MFHHHTHGGGLGLEVRLEPPHLGSLALRVGQDEDASESLDGLQGQRALALEFRSAPLAPGQSTRRAASSACASRPSAPAIF